MKQIELDGFPCRITAPDEQRIRRLGQYLGQLGLDDLIAALRKNYREDRQPAPNVAQSPSPVPSSSPQAPLNENATRLEGIARTGVTASVKTVDIRKFGRFSHQLNIEIANTSQSGTITNIGFFIKTKGKPIWGAKTDRSGEITRPGSYIFTTTDMEILTRDFRVISGFGFLTSTGEYTSSEFLKGIKAVGIPPGGATWFSVAGDGFLDDTGPPLQLGTILRFQGIGKDNLSDIAMYPNLDVLFSPTDPIFQIFKNK